MVESKGGGDLPADDRGGVGICLPAGTTTRYFCGDDPEGLAAVGNIGDGMAKAKYPDWTMIAARDGYIYTSPVGRFPANAFGLYDMHGNVWEWCWDGFDSDYYKRSPGDDPRGPEQTADRVFWCGSRSGAPQYARSAIWIRNSPEFRNCFLGFRVVRVSSSR